MTRRFRQQLIGLMSTKLINMWNRLRMFTKLIRMWNKLGIPCVTHIYHAKIAPNQTKSAISLLEVEKKNKLTLSYCCFGNWRMLVYTKMTCEECIIWLKPIAACKIQCQSPIEEIMLILPCITLFGETKSFFKYGCKLLRALFKSTRHTHGITYILSPTSFGAVNKSVKT